MYDRARASIRAALDAGAGEAPSAARLDAALAALNRLGRRASRPTEIQRFVLALEALRVHAAVGGLGGDEVRTLRAAVDALYDRNVGRRAGTPLGELKAEKARVEASLAARRDDAQALWDEALATHLSERALGPAAARGWAGLGARLLRVGLPLDAAHVLTKGGEPAFAEGFVRAQCLRLAGAHAEAESVLTHLAAAVPHHAAGEDLAWEQLLLAAARSGDPAPASVAYEMRSAHHRPRRILEAFLLIMSGPSTMPLSERAPLRNLARRNSLPLRAEGRLFEVAAGVEGLYATATPLPTRLQRAGRLVAVAATLDSFEHELLAVAAVVRWLARVRAFTPAAVLLARYRANCLAASAGRCADALGMLGDLLGKPWCIGVNSA